MSDMTVLYGIIILFFVMGIVTPFINDDFGTGTSSPDVEGFGDSMLEEASGATSTSIWEILLSVLSMFFWTFGAIPTVIDLVVLMPVRIIGILIIARNIWIGGGG